MRVIGIVVCAKSPSRSTGLDLCVKSGILLFFCALEDTIFSAVLRNEIVSGGSLLFTCYLQEMIYPMQRAQRDALYNREASDMS